MRFDMLISISNAQLEDRYFQAIDDEVYTDADLLLVEIHKRKDSGDTFWAYFD